MEPIWLMWGGLLAAAIGFTGLWAPIPLELVRPDLTETVSRWIVRAGSTVAVVGAAAHVLLP